MDYVGEELELFSHAKNWKNYYYHIIKKYLRGDVLEAGAGIGTTTLAICDGTQKSWVCLEPDGKLGEIIRQKITGKQLPACCTYVEGTLKDIPDERLFDAILYMDVIEHIESDSNELENAFSHLHPGGSLIILAPAHNALYSKFDKKIGHFRRYNKDMLKAILPQKMKIQVLYYLDSLGCILSFSNKIFLKQSYPTVPQIKFWDRVIVPVSRLLDRLSFHRIGKSVLLVAQK